MTGGTLAGMIIADLILGKPNRWADIYDTHRIPPVAAVVAQAQAVIVAHTAEVRGGDGMGWDEVVDGMGDVDGMGMGCGGVGWDEMGMGMGQVCVRG